MLSDPFEVLGISPEATLAQARSAYRRLALKHHPDRNPGDRRAARRFAKIALAYRQIKLMGTTRPAAVPRSGPRPDRYECHRCGDSFPFPETCSRCGVPLHDRDGGPVVREEDPAVAAMIEALLSKAPPREIELPLPIPAILILLSVLSAFFIWQIGPIGPAMLLVAFAGYVAMVEAHRRATSTF